MDSDFKLRSSNRFIEDKIKNTTLNGYKKINTVSNITDFQCILINIENEIILTKDNIAFYFESIFKNINNITDQYLRRSFIETLSYITIHSPKFHIDFLYHNPDLQWNYEKIAVYGFSNLNYWNLDLCSKETKIPKEQSSKETKIPKEQSSKELCTRRNIEFKIEGKIDINFFKYYIYKDWNFSNLKHFKNNFQDNFETHLNLDFVKECIAKSNSLNCYKILYKEFLRFYGSILQDEKFNFEFTNIFINCIETNRKIIVNRINEFNFSILDNNYIRERLRYGNKLTKLCSIPNFNMDYVLKYPISIKWDWNALTLHGNMTLEKATLFFDNKHTREKIYKHMDNLMIQPWMNSWFIKKHITDTHDRAYYLRRLKNSIEFKTYEKNRVLLEDIISYAMKPERLFYWYLDIYELDVEFQDVLPDDHPRKRKF